MNIFITGSEGFVGTHLKQKLLKEGHNVTGLDNLSHPCRFRKGDFIQADIKDIWSYKDIIKDHNFIIHLAAQINVEKSLIDPKDTINTNLIGTLEVLETARKLDIPVIYASTSEIYGDKVTEKKMDETHVINPKSPYAASKLGADGLCKAFYHSYGLKVIIVRNFNTFGMYQSDDKWGAVIAKFADRIINNKAPIIFGDGTQKRDFMSYKDATNFYMLLLKKNNLWGEEFNVGMGRSISINELAKKMIKVSGKEGKIKPIHTDPRPGEVKEFLCDNTKALEIGWKPDLDFDNLLREYIEWKKKYDYKKL